MVSRATAPKRRRAKSTTRVITDTEARELADKWGLLGEDRDAVVSYLPTITGHRRAVEAELKGLKGLPTTKQLHKELSASEIYLKAIKTLFRRDGPIHCSGALSAEAVEWVRGLDELILPLVQEQLLYLDHDIASDKTRVGGRARPQDLKLAESLVDFHAARLSRTRLSRAKFVWDVLDRAGVALGSIEDLIKAARRPATEAGK